MFSFRHSMRKGRVICAFSFVFVFTGAAWADRWTPTVVFRPSCMNSDGMVVPADCCSSNGSFTGANKPECNLGFSSGAQGLVQGLGASNLSAQQSLNTAKELMGMSAQVGEQKGNTSEGANAQLPSLAAVWAAPENPLDTKSANQNLNPRSATSGGSGGSAANAGASPLGLGGSGGTRTQESKDLNKNSAEEKAYALNGYVSGEGKAAGAKEGGADSVKDSGMGDANFLGETKDGLERDVSSEEMLGSVEDPKDYFGRISQSESLFKVVSRRYVKKQSLWVR